MSIQFAKGDRVQLSPVGIHELVVRRVGQRGRPRKISSATVGVIGSPSYCDGCVRVRWEGDRSFDDFAAIYLRAAE